MQFDDAQNPSSDQTDPKPVTSTAVSINTSDEDTDHDATHAQIFAPTQTTSSSHTPTTEPASSETNQITQPNRDSTATDTTDTEEPTPAPMPNIYFEADALDKKSTLATQKPSRAQIDLEKTLDETKRTEEELLTERNAKLRAMPYINLDGLPIESDALAIIPESTAQKTKVAGFRLKGNHLDIAIQNPDNVEAQALINQIERDGFTVTSHIASERSVNRALERYRDLSLTSRTHGSFVDVSEEALIKISNEVKSNADITRLIEAVLKDDNSQQRTTKIVEIIMGSAVATKTSDVHIEPGEDAVRVRYRQDGVLEDIANISAEVYKSLNSRFKILSTLKLTITKDAQDGRFSINYHDTEIEVRVSTIPGPYGEGIVMRLLDPRGLTVEFEKLGIEPKLLEVFKNEIAKPEGIILTTGPTGSGKTTTLYSFLSYLLSPEIKIITIEDPIEYHLAGVQQTQIDHNKGYDFLSGLRAAMRQDPEVVMVGEIRDQETAVTAVQAAQTGHLVLSTLHTNNAAGVIPRLLVLGVNPSLLASTLRLSIAQRLVRRLVSETKIPRKPTEHEERVIRAILKRAFAHNKNLERFGINQNDEITLFEPSQSENSPSGYKGRVGIFEVIRMDKNLESILEDKPTERKVREVANTQGMLTMAEDAVVKLLHGVTSYDEVAKVIDIEEDLEDWYDTPSPDSDSNTQIPDSNTPVKIPDREFSQKNATVLTSGKLDILLAYLAELEIAQRINPTENMASKLSLVREMIVDVLKQEHIPSKDATKNSTTKLKNEIASIIEELHKLEQEQNIDPTIGIAEQIAVIRKTIEELQ